MQIDIQQQFFEMLRNHITKGDSLPMVLGEILKVSNDSVYRRLRGETALTLEETIKIAEYFGVSLDEFMARNINTVVFHYNWLNAEDYNYKTYLTQLRDQLLSISHFKENHIIYLVKDFPLFYNFLIPELAAFKGFFWQKSLLQQPDFKSRKFNLDEIDAEEVILGNEISRIYALIPSTELWNDEAIKGFLSQILYYSDAGYFHKPYHADKLIDKLEQLVTHFALQAEYGCKFLFGKEPDTNLNNYELYYNEIILGDNTVYVRIDGHTRVYHSTNVMNNMYTTLPAYCEQTHKMHMNIIKSSPRLSNSGERERNLYFNKLRNDIERVRSKMND